MANSSAEAEMSNSLDVTKERFLNELVYPEVVFEHAVTGPRT